MVERCVIHRLHSITSFLESISANLSNINLQGAECKISDFGSYVENALSVDDTSSVDGLNNLNKAAGDVQASADNAKKSLSDINNIPLGDVRGEILGLNIALGNTNTSLSNIKSKINDINNTTIDTNIPAPKVKSYKGTVGRAFAKGTLDDIPNTPITGYKGLPHDEKNALRSEYGQPELTVYPNGKTELTDKPVMADLPKGTVIFNEEQTRRILKGNNDKTGNAFASGTAKKTTSSTTTTNDNNNKSSDKTEKKTKNLIDWIEKRINYFSRKVDNWLKRAESSTTKMVDKFYKYASKNMKSLMSTVQM